MRSTTATSEEAMRLAKSSRRDKNVRKETMLAVTATVNQNRTAVASVQSNKAKVALSNASAVAIAIIRRCAAPHMGKRLGFDAPSASALCCHITVICAESGGQLLNWVKT